MNRAIAVALFLGFCALVHGRAEAATLRVAYAVLDQKRSAEDSLAMRWLGAHAGWQVVPARADQAFPGLGKVNVLWIHLPDSLSYASLLNRQKSLDALKAFLGKGGQLLCTGFAAFLAHDLGFEQTRPTVLRDTLQDDWLWDKKGFQSHLGHPILEGLYGGDYVWDARENQVLPIVGYFGTAWPSGSKVLAVDKSYVFIYADRKTVLAQHDGEISREYVAVPRGPEHEGARHDVGAA
ncbi:MAG: hypothetical protein H6Q29_1478 [Bacteroidetes bacterium]|nr:hypothetical protein [Bacteroidota bacterium]